MNLKTIRSGASFISPELLQYLLLVHVQLKILFPDFTLKIFLSILSYIDLCDWSR